MSSYKFATRTFTRSGRTQTQLVILTASGQNFSRIAYHLKLTALEVLIFALYPIAVMENDPIYGEVKSEILDQDAAIDFVVADLSEGRTSPVRRDYVEKKILAAIKLINPYDKY